MLGLRLEADRVHREALTDYEKLVRAGPSDRILHASLASMILAALPSDAGVVLPEVPRTRVRTRTEA